VRCVQPASQYAGGSSRCVAPAQQSNAGQGLGLRRFTPPRSAWRGSRRICRLLASQRKTPGQGPGFCIFSRSESRGHFPSYGNLTLRRARTVLVCKSKLTGPQAVQTYVARLYFAYRYSRPMIQDGEPGKRAYSGRCCAKATVQRGRAAHEAGAMPGCRASLCRRGLDRRSRARSRLRRRQRTAPG
jgi:hypothetical protein